MLAIAMRGLSVVFTISIFFDLRGISNHLDSILKPQSIISLNSSAMLFSLGLNIPIKGMLIKYTPSRGSLQTRSLSFGNLTAGCASPYISLSITAKNEVKALGLLKQVAILFKMYSSVIIIIRK